MDYTTLTLGKLLGSEDVIIKRNAMSILKVLQKCDHRIDRTRATFHDYGECIYCFKKQYTPPHQDETDSAPDIT